MKELSERTREFLTLAGWSAERHIDITPYVSALESEGYVINPFAKKFLEQFGGLVGKQPAYRARDEFENIHFDPIKVCEGIFRSCIETYEEKIKETLVVVGEAHDEHLTLTISESGKMYATYGSYFTLLGNDYIEGLDALFLCKKTPEIDMSA